MSYQVLARKYRPRNFSELVGQESVARALRHALEQNRLHHAYLFTGTRGVGKTTLGRILARCLNCETGVTADPCGQCNACQAISEGRFIDLIEVDAASRTKVEDTRDLLENVQYAPAVGRFKVYLIDEVHMLSSSSFNALLKTLEEPPPHVKFILATTDPQKLPITVLSRCLQFNLRMLPADLIAGHLTALLNEEKIAFEAPALQLIGRAAAGSMRDALSLTDQAIAFGNASVNETSVRELLGSVDRDHVLKLLTALATAKPEAVLDAADEIFAFHPDATGLLDELISCFHQLVVAQLVPQRSDGRLDAWVGRFRPEQLQLYYDIALKGRDDLVRAADGKAALEMLLLRMLLFSPSGVLTEVPVELPASEAGAAIPKKPEAPVAAPDIVSAAPLAPVATAPDTEVSDAASFAATAPPASFAIVTQQGPDPALTEAGEMAADSEPAVDQKASQKTVQAEVVSVQDAPLAMVPPLSLEQTTSVDLPDMADEPLSSDQVKLNDWWCDVLPRLGLGGSLLSLANQAELHARMDNQWTLAVSDDQKMWVDNERSQELMEAASAYFGKPVKVTWEFVERVQDSPSLRAQRQQEQRRRESREAVFADPVVQELIEVLDAHVDEASIQPLNEETTHGI